MEGPVSSVSDGEAVSSVLRSEEELDVHPSPVEAGSVRVRKTPEVVGVERDFDVQTEHAEFDRAAVGDEDSGEIETLADGSVSVPVFEEVLVVRRELRVRERVIVKKHTTVATQTIRDELLRERVEVEADPGVDLRKGTLGATRTAA